MSSSNLSFEIPSKTFILGEYLALQGTASMILASGPSFNVHLKEAGESSFHPESPAGKLLKKLNLEKLNFELKDPHNGLGGFGRSTAEYLAVQLYSWKVKKEFQDPVAAIFNQLEEFIEEYKSFSDNSIKPSGADLVAQLQGGICWYDGMNFNAETLEWPFPGYTLLVFHTGKKIATHGHLKDLTEKNFRSLIPTLFAGRTGFSQGNLKVFAESINYYYDQLNDLGLSDKVVHKQVLQLREYPQVLAAKGCGAMGADTVLVLCEASHQAAVSKLASTYGFKETCSLKESHVGAQVGEVL